MSRIAIQHVTSERQAMPGGHEGAPDANASTLDAWSRGLR